MQITYIARSGAPQILVEGTVSSGHVARLIRAFVKDPEFRTGRGLLLDGTLHHIRYSHDEVFELARELAPLAARVGGRAAVVVPLEDSVHFGLARMFASYAGSMGFEVAVFFDREQAQEWVESSDAGAETTAET